MMSPFNFIIFIGHLHGPHSPQWISYEYFSSIKQTPILISTYQKNEKVVMAITDNGGGIAEEHLPRHYACA